MITLHVFGPGFGLFDPSPFVMKADVLLKMSGVPFKTTGGDLRKSPKHKLPFIEDDGVRIGDSTLIRLHLEKKYGVDFDKFLSGEQKGFAWAVEKMLEDNLYWAVLFERWCVEENFQKGPKNFFAPIPSVIRPFIVASVRRTVRANLYGQGLGRHTRNEIITLGNRAIDALSAALTDKTYLMGANKCGADATAFTFALSALCPHFDTPIRTNAERHRNLVAYCDRMQREFYSG